MLKKKTRFFFNILNLIKYTQIIARHFTGIIILFQLQHKYIYHSLPFTLSLFFSISFCSILLSKIK